MFYYEFIFFYKFFSIFSFIQGTPVLCFKSWQQIVEGIPYSLQKAISGINLCKADLLQSITSYSYIHKFL